MIKKLFKWIASIFSKREFFINKYLLPSIKTVEQLKKIIDSPAVDVVTAFIPSNIDNFIVEKIRVALPKVLLVLNYSKEGEGVLNSILSLKELNPEARKAAYHLIAVKLAEYLSDGKLTWSECVMLSEYIYKNEIK